MDNKIKVIICEPQKEPYVKEINNDLSTLQKIVGGYIEVFHPFEDSNVCIICNEEGKINGLPINRVIRGSDNEVIDVIVGAFIIADCSNEDFGSLSYIKLLHYTSLFKSMNVIL